MMNKSSSSSNRNSTIVFDTSLEVEKTVDGHIINWSNIQKQIEDECEEYERAAAAGYNVVRGSEWDSILAYLNGMRYCKSCSVYRKASVDNPNRCPVCNRCLQKRWSRRMENKILYRDLDKDRIKALQRLSERMGWNGLDGRPGCK